MIKTGRFKPIRLGNGRNAVYRIPASDLNILALEHLEIMIGAILDKKMIESSKLNKTDIQ